MSRLQTTRRLRLLTGASYAAASICGAASLMTGLAPGAALAQTCTPTAVAVTGSTSAADTVQCQAGTFATGITYSSNGPLAVTTVPAGSVVATTVTANGVNLTGNGSDSITWDSTIGTVTGGTGTAGPVIEARTASGAITISTAGVAGTSASVTHAIQAVSSNGGAVTLTATGAVTASNVTSGVAAIEATTSGGNANVSVTTGGNVTGRLRGILTQSAGTGVTTLNIGGGVSAGAPTGIAIEAVSGAGGAVVNITAGAISGSSGTALRMSGATAAVNIGGGRISGAIDLTGVSGSSAINITGTTATSGWHAAGTTTLGAGATTLNIAADSGLFSGTASTVTLDFGAGTDVLNNDGRMIVGENAGTNAGTLVLGGLETFNHRGTIYLGGGTSLVAEQTTDGGVNDVLRMASGTFNGDGGVVVFDANLGATTDQTGCATLTAADCLDLRGATTAGKTLVRVNSTSPLTALASGPRSIVLVDVGGAGSSAAGHFVLDPSAANYEPIFGGAVRQGLFIFPLVYDAAAQLHRLVKAPATEAYQTPLLATAAQDLWRVSLGGWFDRQAELREDPARDGLGGHVWLRASADFTQRDVVNRLETSGVTLDYDNGYQQDSWAVTGGADLVAGQGYVVGVMLGYANADLAFDDSPTRVQFNGLSGGVYAGYVGGPLFVDAAVNGTVLKMDEDPALDITPAGRILTENVQSIGGRIEAGWKLGVGEFFLEPLAAVSYVQTRIGDLDFPTPDPDQAGATAVFDDPTSLRGSLGLRLGSSLEHGGFRAQYAATGRIWNEFEGENHVLIDNPGPDLPMTDDFSGTFGELGVGVSVVNDLGASGFLNLGGRFQDDYRSINGSVGLTYRW